MFKIVRSARANRISELERYERLIDAVANGDGFTTETRGVKIQKCDEYGRTDTDYKLQLAQVYVDQERQLVDMIAAERDALAEKLGTNGR